jgi:hypothetical protein
MKSKVILGIMSALVLATLSTTVALQQSAEAKVMGKAAAPAVVSGENVYLAWWTNETANSNEEAMFRASTDGGQTFGDKLI